jgi:histidinol phosphatase-like PHP family hydrolase
MTSLGIVKAKPLVSPGKRVVWFLNPANHKLFMKKNDKHILADMHTHLNEKKIKPKKYWEAAKKRKLSAIAITEHSNYKPKEAYLKLKLTQPKEIMLIPGIEAKTTAGDLLIYGTDESIYEIKALLKINIPIKTALKTAKENHLLISFAHPYGYKYDSTCEVIGEKKTLELVKKYGTGIEYYNGMLGSATEILFGRKFIKRIYSALNFFEQNKATNKLKLYKGTKGTKLRLEKIAEQTLERVKKAIAFSEKAPFLTVGSDAHYPSAIGSAVIELQKKPRNEKEFLAMIKNKKTKWKGPNIYSREPVQAIGKKEMLEGITYLIKKNILKKRKLPLAGKINRKIRLGKRIKTIKRITKKANLKKIRQKIDKIKKLKKKIRIKRIIKNIPGKKIVARFEEKIGLVK